MLAQASVSLTGWYVGYAIGVVVVIVVVVVVVAITQTASTIARQAGKAVDALDDAQRNTHALWGIARVNQAAGRLLADAQAARQALGG